MKKKSKIGFLLVASLLILTACGTSEVTANSSDFWEKLVYFFAEMIQFLSFNGSTGIGIILFYLDYSDSLVASLPISDDLI